MSGFADRYSDPLDRAFGDEPDDRAEEHGHGTSAPQREPPYLKGLNPEQREAVLTIDGPVLVLAGAGTGKTRVLTTRLAHILATRRAWPGQILAGTFTNKAAREMKERIGALIGGVVEGMQWLGTFHSIGARMLRRHAELAGLKSNFTILDADDQLALMKQLIEAENIDEKRWPARTLGSFIDDWKNRGLRPEDVPGGAAHAYAKGKGRTLYSWRGQRPDRRQQGPPRQDPVDGRRRRREDQGAGCVGCGGRSPRRCHRSGESALQERAPGGNGGAGARLIPDARIRRSLPV